MKQNLYSCALRLCVKVCVQHILPALKFSDSEGKTFMIKISLCTVGFDNGLYFSKTFHKKKGASPKAYRIKIRGTE